MMISTIEIDDGLGCSLSRVLCAKLYCWEIDPWKWMSLSPFAWGISAWSQPYQRGVVPGSRGRDRSRASVQNARYTMSNAHLCVVCFFGALQTWCLVSLNPDDSVEAESRHICLFCRIGIRDDHLHDAGVIMP